MENKTVLENIAAYYPEMFSAEQKVAKYILNNPRDAVMTNVSELARLSGVSDATVIRMCKRIGYQGYYQMKIVLSNDLGRDQFDDLRANTSPPTTIKNLFQIFAANILDVAANLADEEFATCIELIKKAEMVHIAAAGNTAPIANDFGFRLERFGIRSSYSMVSEYFLNHVGLAGPADLLIAISHSGASKQVLQAMELAKKKNLPVIAITGQTYSPVSQLADHVLLSKAKNPVFPEYCPDSHLEVQVIVDALLYFLGNEERLKHSDSIELMLAEYKL